MSDPERLERAFARFRAFFAELKTAFVEREDVLAQIALGLLAKEHVLLTGPPGTAKSQVASAVFGRIVCEQTGAPSLFARQITESTVQTDLIGPVDFKTLTETGRTTHFTDEGILGSAHAFLDEVFDGRDMLLRSTLNVLQERELKQGGVITRGHTECALLTSNRYVSEVLEQSRETLLAFVDRIAFVAFVPRGFADPDSLSAVLRRRVGGAGRASLDALLTIQDLDLLQAAVSEVWVAPELCDSVASLLARFDAETASAVRADPSFVPTRYLSTRTAVRCTELLRAIAIYDRIFVDTRRTVHARHDDLRSLRLHLVLAGPSPSDVAQLLERESDPVERRQLEILRTEREIFEACFEKLERKKLTLPTSPPTPRPSAPSASTADSAKATPAPDAQGDGARSFVQPSPTKSRVDLLAEELEAAVARGDDEQLLSLARELAERARSGAPDEARARALLEHAASALAALGLRESLALADPGSDLLRSTRRLARLASSLEDDSVSMHATATLLHERALDAVLEVASHGLGLDADTLLLASGSGAFDASSASRRILEAATELAQLRHGLLTRSSSYAGDAPDPRWEQAMSRVADELCALWSRSFAETWSGSLRGRASAALPELLEILGPELGRLGEVDAQLSKLAGKSLRVRERVLGPRLRPILEASLSRSDLSDRGSLVEQVRTLHAELGRHELGAAVSPAEWLELVARTLRGAEPAHRPPAESFDRDGYRALRRSEQRSPILGTLAEIALVVSPPALGNEAKAGGAHARAVLSGLDPRLATEVAEVDLARAGRAVDYLERWWSEVMACDASERPEREAPLLELFWDEAALTRFALEALLVEQLVPSAEREAQALRERIDALRDDVRGASLDLVRSRADAILSEALAQR